LGFSFWALRNRGISHGKVRVRSRSETAAGGKMAFVNVGLLKHPMNWLVIILMLVIAAMAGHLLLSYFGVEPSTANS
jgi:hypothetical protein